MAITENRFHVAPGEIASVKIGTQISQFRATSIPPFPFEWVDLTLTEKEYSSLLLRLSPEYDKRFRS